MSDDLDDLLRRAMTTLDHQAPDGYFETLASRTLARLDDPAIGEPRDDDSGLQDIRNLANETKARLSSRRSSNDLIASDDDRLASSSAGWKAVALPEPARPPALPPPPAGAVVDELARERAARDARTAQTRPASAAVTAGPAAPPPAGQAGPDRRPILAVAGLALAAAAGAVIFVSAGDKAAPAAMQERVRARSYAQEAEPAGPAAANSAPAHAGLTVTPIETTTAAGSAAAPEPASQAQAGAADRGASVGKQAIGDPPPVKPVAKKLRPGKGGAKGAYPSKLANDPVPDDPSEGSAAEPAPPTPRTGSGTSSGSDAGEPSLDKLLQEAGVHDPKPAKPKLARTSLSSDDIKRGMTAVAPRAQACFAGTQGLAVVRLTVAPSGQVQAVAVTGAFAGTPVAACVERVVRAATFPAWDGGPQSFGYDYLLAE